VSTIYTGTAQGWLKPDPKADSIKFRPGWLIVQCDRDWTWLMQRWLTLHGHGRWAQVIDRARVMPDGRTVDREPRLARVLDFVPPAWGPHISVTRGERVSKSKAGLRRSLKGRLIDFRYSPDLQFNGEYFWFWVQCDELLDLREQLGLRRTPKQRLHLTVGRVS
jgi:hypothetical protein